MRLLQPETDNHGASLLQRGPDRSVRPQIHVCSPQIAAEHRQLAAGSEIIVPVAQEHHRHIGGSLLAADPVAPVPVHTEQHRLPDNFRRNLLPFKEVRQRVEHGRRAAVILGQLIMQRIFHRVRLISLLSYMNYRNPSFPCQYAFPGGPEPISVFRPDHLAGSAWLRPAFPAMGSASPRWHASGLRVFCSLRRSAYPDPGPFLRLMDQFWFVFGFYMDFLRCVWHHKITEQVQFEGS